MKYRCAIGAFVFAGIAPLTAWAQPHAGDITLSIQNGAIATGAFQGTFQPVRVFTTQLGTSFANFTADPGFDCAPGTFPVGSRNGFRVLDALRVWNGTDFGALSTERMEVAFSSLSVLTPQSPQAVEGFTLLVGSNGQWHRHLEYTLLDPASSGVYLLTMQVYSNQPSIGQSQPFWIVFNQNSSPATLEAAAQWVQANLATQPSTCGSADFDGDGDSGTDADIEAFFACLAGDCCSTCFGADFDGDGDTGTDADIESFFRVLAGGNC